MGNTCINADGKKKRRQKHETPYDMQQLEPALFESDHAQTKQARIMFTENSGLAWVLPIDFIDETIAAYQSAFSTASPAEPDFSSHPA